MEALAIGAMAQLKQLDDAVAQRRGLKKGRISLAIVSTAKYFVPMLLVKFRQRYPDIEVALTIHNREGIAQLLARNEIDLVIMGRAPENIDCEATAFATNPLGVIGAPAHRLSRRRAAPLSILDGEAFVVREHGSGTRHAMERLFAEHAVRPRIVMEMPSNETIKQAVMAGMGLSFLSLVRHWHITHLAAARLSPAAREFKAFLMEEAGRLMAAWA